MLSGMTRDVQVLRNVERLDMRSINLPASALMCFYFVAFSLYLKRLHTQYDSPSGTKATDIPCHVCRAHKRAYGACQVCACL